MREKLESMRPEVAYNNNTQQEIEHVEYTRGKIIYTKKLKLFLAPRKMNDMYKYTKTTIIQL